MNPESPLSNLLDSVYELEGLIHLALNRDNPPAALSDLIVRKARTIAETAPEAVADQLSGPAPEESVETVETVETEIVETPAQTVAEETEAFIPMETVSPDYALGEDYSESSDFATSAIPSSVPEMAPAPSSASSATAHSEPAAPVQRKRGKLVFNLNDRYRFRRSLFHGNDTDFTAALSTAADAATYADAESYFYSVLGWNPEDEEVRAFMQLLENYYN